MRRRACSDSGAAGSLTMVLLVPVFCVLATMAVQAASWGHSRSQVRAVAHATSVTAARGSVAVESAAASARASLSSIDGLEVESVVVVAENGFAATSVVGRVPGLVYGVGADIQIVEVVPIERWRP